MNKNPAVHGAASPYYICWCKSLWKVGTETQKHILNRKNQWKDEMAMLWLITRQQILDSSKLKDFEDDNFKFDKNSRKLFKPVENTVGKTEIAISPFPTMFPKGLFPKGIKRCHCVGMG